MLALSRLVIYLQIFEHVIVRVFPLIPNSFDTYFCWCLYFGNPPRPVYNPKHIIPRTQMTLVLNGRGLLWVGSSPKIEDQQVTGIIYIYSSYISNLNLSVFPDAFFQKHRKTVTKRRLLFSIDQRTSPLSGEYDEAISGDSGRFFWGGSCRSR